ncbi:hypothetical protein ABZ371_23070 [Streptomyces sp. NPDC005899]|uniref:hypothetical protein n=1 Tax=Streptomyces sp. NPDC005899 TaxID=3155716 RepID=UPI0033D86519
MNLSPYVADIRREFAVAVDAEGEEARAAADRLTLSLDAATRLMLLTALSDAAAEISAELAPGSVSMRLRNRRPEFVCDLPPDSTTPSGRYAGGPGSPEPTPPASPALLPPLPEGQGAVARINLRLPAPLKRRAEEAADREWLSLNAWLVRAITDALADGDPRTVRGGPTCAGSRRQPGRTRPAMP